MVLKLKLREWEKSGGVELTSVQLDELRQIKNLRIDTRSDGLFDVTSVSNSVGYVRRGSTTVLIEPSKCDAKQIFLMMGYSEDLNMFGHERVGYGDDDDLHEVFVSVFVRALTKAISGGVYRSYTLIEDDLRVVRGRIRLSDQLSRRMRLSPPIAVEFDEFTSDNIENRLLKSAVEAVMRMPLRNSDTNNGLQFLRSQFSGVRSVEFTNASIPEIPLHRLNAHLKFSMELGRKILENSSITLDHGENSSDEFLINMASVFENFVVTALRDELQVGKLEMPRANELRDNPYLDTQNLIKLKPDLSRWQNSDCIAVGDVKYKRTNAEGVVHPDIYQLLAYATATNLERASVIYAYSRADTDELMVGSHAVAGTEIQIDVYALDLSLPFPEILAQIAEFSKSFEPALSIS